MFSGYILVAFLFMGLLFIRHIYIFRQGNRINYAPLVIIIGSIGSAVHFITHSEINNVVLLIRESLFPLLISLLLYFVMNILNQTQNSQHSKNQEDMINNLVNQIDELKTFASELERKMILSLQRDATVQEDFNNRFNQDIKSLEAIQTNQGKFLEKFEELNQLHKDVSDSFKKFADVQMPALDDVVHKHIDILRVSEQDHYNKVKGMLEKAVENRYDITEDLHDLKENIKNMKGMSESISESITKNTMQQLNSGVKVFEKELLTLKSHTESVGTTLYESENRLNGIKTQSEMIIKQMVIASKNMESLESQNSRVYEMSTIMQDLIDDINMVKTDYIKAQSELTSISKEIKSSDEELILDMKVNIDSLGNELRKKIDESLEKLSEYYHLASKDISPSVEILAKKNRLKSYTQLDEKKD